MVIYKVIEWTLDEWLAQQALIGMYKIQPSVSPDVIRRLERLEQLVFGKENDCGK